MEMNHRGTATKGARSDTFWERLVVIIVGWLPCTYVPTTPVDWHLFVVPGISSSSKWNQDQFHLIWLAYTPAYRLLMSDHWTFDVSSAIFSCGGTGSPTSFHKTIKQITSQLMFQLASIFEPQLHRISRSTRQCSPPKIVAPWHFGGSKYPYASLFYRMARELALQDPS